MHAFGARPQNRREGYGEVNDWLCATTNKESVLSLAMKLLVTRIKSETRVLDFAKSMTLKESSEDEAVKLISMTTGSISPLATCRLGAVASKSMYGYYVST